MEAQKIQTTDENCQNNCSADTAADLQTELVGEIEGMKTFKCRIQLLHEERENSFDTAYQECQQDKSK